MDPKHEASGNDPKKKPSAHKPETNANAVKKPSGAPEKDDDSQVDLSRPGAPTGASSGSGNDEKPSGISVIEWAALVEEDPPADSGSEAKFDAPSDAEWAKKTTETGRKTTDQAIDLENVDAVEEAANVETGSDEEEPTIVPGSASDIDLDEPDVMEDDLEVVRDAFAVGADSKEKMAAPTPELEGPLSGVVDLGEDLAARHDDPLAPSNESLQGMESANASTKGKESVDLTQSPEHATSAVDLGAKPAGGPQEAGTSEIDLFEEAQKSEAGQGAAAKGSGGDGGAVDSDVIEAKLVQDVVRADEGGEAVALGESASPHGKGSSVNLAESVRKTPEGESADGELGSASGQVVSSDLDSNKELEAEGAAAEAPDSDAVEYGTDEDINLDSKAPTTPIPDKKAEKPEKKQRSGSGIVGWLGGGFVGAAVATGACVALWSFGLLPGGEVKPATRPQAVVPQKQPPSFAEKLAFLRNGDFDKAAEAGIETADENNAEQLEARGEYRWLSYFKKQRLANGQFKADDEPVKLALADLDKAASMESAKPDAKADALLWKGHIEETLNNVDAARKTYTDAATLFAVDPVLKHRFDAARIRLELRTPAKPAGVGQLPLDEKERQILIARLLALVQAGEAPAKPDTAEAGYDFWDAVDLARKQNFAEAEETAKRPRSARQTPRRAAAQTAEPGQRSDRGDFPAGV